MIAFTNPPRTITVTGLRKTSDREFVLADLMQRNVGPGQLRAMLSRAEPVLAPGAYDALTARLVEQGSGRCT